jgi:thymidylate kinase
VRRRFLELAAADSGRWRVLDAAADPDRLEEQVWAAIAPRLPRGARML